MDYEEMESELEMAGIDPFEFSLMDEDERREALEDSCLDPWDFEDFDLEYPGYSYSPPPAPAMPKPPVTEPSPIIRRPAITPGEPVNLNPSPIIHRPPITYDNAPKDQTVIRKQPDSSPAQRPAGPLSPDRSGIRQRQAEIDRIDRKMKQIRTIILLLASLLLIVIVAGIGASYRSPSTPVSTYTIQPSTKIVSMPSPTPRATPRPTATPKPTAPYVGMRVPVVPSGWQWQGTDNLTVKDTAGNGVKTIRYRFDLSPKSYSIWVRASDNTVVKVSVSDPTASTKKKSSTKKKPSSDPYHASDYAHPDDFYEWYYDDFYDFEEAEDYWEAHH